MILQPSDIQEEQRPAGDLVAYRPCGCVGFAAADMITNRAETAIELARCVMLGWRPGYLTTEEVRSARWGCDQCSRGANTPAEPPIVIHASFHKDAPRFHITGKMTYRVTINVNAIVVANTEDAAQEALTEELSPTSLHDDEAIAEWDDDNLKIATLPPEADITGNPSDSLQMALPLE